MRPLGWLTAMALSGCAASTPLILAGDEVTGRGQFTEAVEPRMPVNADRPLALLGQRVTLAVPAPWRLERQEYLRQGATIEWSVAAASPSRAARVALRVSLAPAGARLAETAAAWRERGTPISDSSDGDSWRTLVLTTTDAVPRLVLARLALVAGMAFELSASFPAEGADPAWVERLAAEFNRVLCQIRIDGQNRCESAVVVSRHAP